MTQCENPFIKVVWRDVPENFSKEKIKRVKTYFQTKYKSNNIKIVPESIINYDDTTLKSVDLSEKLTDENHQKKLMKEFIKENNIDVKWELIERLDKKVNESLKNDNIIANDYNNWKIKKIEFSNFLSFGDNNVIDFEKFEGITVVESNPENFGGKTTSTVDLLMFLFFGTTTKTKTNIEIFNLYRDKDEVEVKGTITIDNEDYIIERKITRKKSKNGDYNVTNSLDFMKIESDGNIVNLKGEQRKETEKFIVSSIGTEEDFLSTILTTGNNLEDLIESKPTARGQLLSKFLGLETFKLKEDTAKKMFSEWSKKLVSNTNDVIELKNEIESSKEIIEKSKHDIDESNKKIVILESEIEKSESIRESLYLKRHNDIDEELIKINLESIEKELNLAIQKKNETVDNFNKVIVEEPKEYYSEDKHSEIQKSINDLLVEKETSKKQIDILIRNIKQLEEGEFCPTCKRKLDDVDHSDEIKKMKKELETLQKANFDKLLLKLKEDLDNILKIKSLYDIYEKNKLIKAKYEIEIEQKDIDIENKKSKIDKYNNNKQKLEINKKIDEELIKLKSKIETLRSDLKIENFNIDTKNNLITTSTNKIEQNNQLIKTINSEQEFVNAFKVYFTIFGKNGISKVIMRNMIPLLNIELYKLLNDSCYFNLELNINDKNEIEFLMIDNETRLVKLLNTGSGYEKTISSLALRSVLTKISSLPKPNIVVMDEVFGKVANNNLELVGEFFKKIKNYFEHIFVISHNELIRNWSDRIIMIKKENHVSSIEYVSN